MKPTPHTVVPRPILIELWYGALVAAFAVACVLWLTGCTILNPDGTRTYDPVKSAQVVAALTVPVQETVRRVIVNSPQHSDEIAAYFRAVGNVFCRMEATGQFTPDQLIAEVEKATQPLQTKVDPLAITVKNTAVALYTIFYSQRHTAQLSPEKWPAHVAKLFCTAIDVGLTDAGKGGVDWKQ